MADDGWRQPKANKRYLAAIAREQLQRAQQQREEEEAAAAAAEADEEEEEEEDEDEEEGEEEEEEEEEEEVPSSKTSNKKHKVCTPALEEHRLAPFLPNPPAKVVDRISRAFTHRLYLIDKTLSVDSPPLSCDFIILGATGNVYTVKLDLLPSCTCPDYENGNTCKHILFVMLRVLKVSRDDPRVWQRAFLPSELHALLENLSVNDGILASERVRQQFSDITKQTVPAASNEEASFLKPGQRAIDGDCPICYEPMAGNGGKPVEPVVFCKVCGNNVHSDCFKRWSQSKVRGRVTCIYCRAIWEQVDGMWSHDKKYINLASY